MDDPIKSELLALLRQKSVFHGDFVLSSGAHSKYYVDCKLTTFDSKGAWLVGEAMYNLIRQTARSLNCQIRGVGGLTMGADPVSLAVGMMSQRDVGSEPLKTFSVRKSQKSHGQAKLIEGNFKEGDLVVVIDDVITKGESTLKAIEAVVQAGENRFCCGPGGPPRGRHGKNPGAGLSGDPVVQQKRPSWPGTAVIRAVRQLPNPPAARSLI